MWAHPLHGFQAARTLRGTEALALSLQPLPLGGEGAYLLQSSIVAKGGKGVRVGAGTGWISANPVSP